MHIYELFKNLAVPLEVNHGPCIKHVPLYRREVSLKGGPGGFSSPVSHTEILMPPLCMGVMMAASCLLCHVDSAPFRPHPLSYRGCTPGHRIPRKALPEGFQFRLPVRGTHMRIGRQRGAHVIFFPSSGGKTPWFGRCGVGSHLWSFPWESPAQGYRPF